ncbi:MAG TPA: hypothetical protein VGI45_22495 [Terracidiphilus sp.]|jgi:hypothetical protein
MRQWVGIGLLVVIAIAIFNIVSFIRRKDDDKRYLSTLMAYRSVLKPGTSRAEVEDYLRQKGMPYARSCCEPDVFSDRSKIGELPPHFTCRNWNVYLDFQFQGSNHADVARGTDQLTKIDLYENGQCL